MSIDRVTHVGIGVSDLERSTRFYRDLLGFDVLSELEIGGEPTDVLLELEGSELHAVYLERDGLRLELLHFAAPKRRRDRLPRKMDDLGFTHFSIRVRDLEVCLRALRAAGVVVRDRTRLDFPEVGAGAVMIEDPDGLLIELVQSPGDPAQPPGA
jgi:catechol 2,3-dioxygenase-like lactoylglutathione lyase family enzyme